MSAINGILKFYILDFFFVSFRLIYNVAGFTMEQNMVKLFVIYNVTDKIGTSYYAYATMIFLNVRFQN